MVKWLVAKFDGGMYTKRQALVIAFFTISLWAGMSFAIGYGIYCVANGIALPPSHNIQPYD